MEPAVAFAESFGHDIRRHVAIAVGAQRWAHHSSAATGPAPTLSAPVVVYHVQVHSALHAALHGPSAHALDSNIWPKPAVPLKRGLSLENRPAERVLLAAGCLHESLQCMVAAYIALRPSRARMPQLALDTTALVMTVETAVQHVSTALDAVRRALIAITGALPEQSPRGTESGTSDTSDSDAYTEYAHLDRAAALLVATQSIAAWLLCHTAIVCGPARDILPPLRAAATAAASLRVFAWTNRASLVHASAGGTTSTRVVTTSERPVGRQSLPVADRPPRPVPAPRVLSASQLPDAIAPPGLYDYDGADVPVAPLQGSINNMHGFFSIARSSSPPLTAVMTDASPQPSSSTAAAASAPASAPAAVAAVPASAHKSSPLPLLHALHITIALVTGSGRDYDMKTVVPHHCCCTTREDPVGSLEAIRRQDSVVALAVDTEDPVDSASSASHSSAEGSVVGTSTCTSRGPHFPVVSASAFFNQPTGAMEAAAVTMRPPHIFANSGRLNSVAALRSALYGAREACMDSTAIAPTPLAESLRTVPGAVAASRHSIDMGASGALEAEAAGAVAAAVDEIPRMPWGALAATAAAVFSPTELRAALSIRHEIGAWEWPALTPEQAVDGDGIRDLLATQWLTPVAS